MSVIEPHLSDLRGGFGGYGFTSRVGLGSGPMLPLWRPTPTPAVSYCTSPTCPCSLPRPYIMSDLYDYPPGFSYSWAAWYYKTGNYQFCCFFNYLVYKSFFFLPKKSQKSRATLLDGSRFLDMFWRKKKHLMPELHKTSRIIF